ncbi:PTPRB (predicted) [Pycnogonum litorale]
MHETTLTTIIGNATSTYAGETSTVSATNAKSTILQTEGANITLGLSNTESSLTSRVTISGNATTENGSISETPSTEITNVTNKITTLSLGNKTVTEGIKVPEVNGSSTSSWTKMHETTLSGFTSTGITLSPTVSVNVTETSGISSKGKSSQTTYTVYETTTGSSSTETIDASSTVTKVTILPGSSEKLTDEVTTLSVPSTNQTTRATVITSTVVSSVSTGSTDESRKPTSSPTDEGGMTNSTEASGSSAMHVTNGTTTSSNGNKNITEEISRTSRGVLSTREMTSATGHGITNNTITSSTGLTSPFPVTTDDLTTDEIKATTEDVLSTKPDEVTTEITRKITTTSEKPLNLTTAGNPLQSTEKGSTIDVQTTLIRTSSPSTTIAFEITVKVSNITSHSADIRWTTSMFGYTLVFLIAHDGKILTKVQAKCNELKVNVTRLEPYTRYNIVIRLMDSNHSLRDLKFNGAHDFMTSVYVPSAPTSVRFECLNSTSGLATWNPPKTPNGIIELYNLTLTGIKDGYPDHILRVKTSLCSEEGGSRIGRKRIVCSYNVDNVLRPSYEYRLKVKAKTLSVPKWGPQSVSSPGCVTESAIPPFPKKTLSIVEHHTHRPDVKSQVSFQFPEDVFSSVNGEITSYAVILASKGFMSPPSNGSLTGYNCLESWNDVYLKSGKNREPIFEYQASPPLWCPMKGSFDPLKCILYKSPQTSAHIQCIIGWQRNCTTRKTAKNTYCNGPLRDDTEYSMKLRGFTSSGYADSPLLEFKTDPVPDEDGIDKDSLSAGIIAGIIIPIVTLIACAAVFVSYKRKRFPFSEKAVDAPSMISSNQHDVNMMEMKPKPQESSFDGAVSYKDFALHVRRLLADSALLFSQEYNTLKEMSPQKSVNDAKLEENRRKNRWINILPYDCSRVKLLPIADEAGSDYINASYIPGYHSPREYIATQGPLQNTVDDFWRLVWEQDVSVIVMVTQCVERGKKKCETYWPETREPRHYGDIRITMTSESILSSFCIRVFLLQLGKHDRVVKQLHFTRWPDFGCPEDTGSLLNFVQTVRTHTPHVAGGPILVHCSAGVGRTGTFITVDTWLHHIDDQSKSASTHRRCIDIFNTVFRMRHHRLNMVQTEDQYIYIHECIRDYLQESCQNTNSLEAGSYEIYENLAMVKDDIARV